MDQTSGAMQEERKPETNAKPGWSMQVEADESPALGQLAAALAKAQGEIRNASKDTVNQHLRTRYADLASTWDACRAPLAKNELAIIQRITNVHEGVLITTMLVHSSGEFVRDRLTIPVAQQISKDGNKQPITHAMGSAITYGRRYALSAMVGVAAGDDDDDGGASAREPHYQGRQETGGNARTEAVKQQVRAQAAEAVPAGPTVWEQIKAACLAAGLEKDKIGDFVKGVTKKSKPQDLSEADLVTVKEVLAGAPANKPTPVAVPITASGRVPTFTEPAPTGSKFKIVDVQAGETEEQALARAKKAEADVPF